MAYKEGDDGYLSSSFLLSTQKQNIKMKRIKLDSIKMKKPITDNITTTVNLNGDNDGFIETNEPIKTSHVIKTDEPIETSQVIDNEKNMLICKLLNDAKSSYSTLTATINVTHDILGITRPKPSWRQKSAVVLGIELSNRLSEFLRNADIVTLKTIISGKMECLTPICQNIRLTHEIHPNTEERTKLLQKLLYKLDTAQLWDVIKGVSTYAFVEKEKEQEQNNKQNTNKKISKKVSKNIGYVEMTNDDAALLVGFYLKNVEDVKEGHDPNKRPANHYCFKEGGVSNVTNAMRRLLYTYLYKEDCQTVNNIAPQVYDVFKQSLTYKKANLAEALEIIERVKNNYPDYMEEVKSWREQAYMKSALKK